MTIDRRLGDYVAALEGRNSLLESVERISPTEAKSRGLMGPLYHGTMRGIDDIRQNGFDVSRSIPRGVGLGVAQGLGGSYIRDDVPIGSSNGYAFAPYGYTGIAPPIHHLGFGVYFTTVKAIAKMYGGNSMKGVIEFYANVPDMIEINFAAERTMMKWWLQNGYTMTPEATEKRDFNTWAKATMNLTKNLRKYGAVHFLGKSGFNRALDGDQVCIYDPSVLVIVDKKLATGLDVGSKVVHTGDTKAYIGNRNDLYVDDVRPTDFGGWGKLGQQGGWRGVFWSHRQGVDLPRSEASPIHLIPPTGMVGEIINVRDHPTYGTSYDVRWAKGGVQYNYKASELSPYSGRKSNQR
jgi:hypothetical protein